MVIVIPLDFGLTVQWVGTCALSSVYPNLFAIVYDKYILVSQVFTLNGLHIEFARQLVRVYHSEWCALLTQFQYFRLSEENDHIVWRWTSHGRFSVHSLYTWLEFGRAPYSDFSSIWQAHIPLNGLHSFN